MDVQTSTEDSFAIESPEYDSDDFQLRFTPPTLDWTTSEDDDELEYELFRSLCMQWREQTRHMALASLRYLNPNYQQILTMGPKIIPWILEELKIRPDRWFVALKLLSREDPVTKGSTFDDGVNAWLDWGRSRGIDV